MPFEPAPKVEAPAKVGTFQKFADAMLLGCARSLPVRFRLYEEADEGLQACALGAMRLGLLGRVQWGSVRDEERAVHKAYRVAYGRIIEEDNDSGAFTREQIAARIAAL